MRIAILSRGPQLYSTRRLVEAAQQRGHETKILNTMRFGILVEQGGQGGHVSTPGGLHDRWQLIGHDAPRYATKMGSGTDADEPAIGLV